MAPSATLTTEQHSSISLSRDLLNKGLQSKDGVKCSEGLVKDALKERINVVNTDTCEAGEEDAFFVADMGDIYRQHLRWKMNLKRVKPHYGQ